MHAGLDELNAGAGEPCRCAVCRTEPERVKALRRELIALPASEAPAGAFGRARERLRARTSGPAARAVPVGRGLPLAACLLALMTAAILHATRAPAPVAGVAAWQPDGELYAENARLEALLAALPEPRRTRLHSAYTVAALEERLAVVDDGLSSLALEPHAPELAEQLWQERVTLMNSLVQVQYARTLTAR